MQMDVRAPLYARVEEALLQRIRGQYRPGQLLPTQRELAREFNASLITIKRALSEIGRRGYLQSTRGRGTVVTRPVVEDNRAGVSSWTDSMTGVGRLPKTVECVVRVHVPRAGELSRLLGLKAREKVVALDRLRTLDGEPWCVMRNELPLKLVPDLVHGLPEESFYAWLKSRHGLVPARADEEVFVRPPTPREEKFLGPGPVIVVRRHSTLDDGRPLEVAELAASADRYRYRVEIVRR